MRQPPNVGQTSSLPYGCTTGLSRKHRVAPFPLVRRGASPAWPPWLAGLEIRRRENLLGPEPPVLGRDPLAEAGFVIPPCHAGLSRTGPPWPAGLEIRRQRESPAVARESGGGERVRRRENLLGPEPPVLGRDPLAEAGFVIPPCHARLSRVGPPWPAGFPIRRQRGFSTLQEVQNLRHF